MSSLSFRRMLELEMDRLSFRQKIFEVRFALDQEEALFMAQVEFIIFIPWDPFVKGPRI